jgi:urate oxidase
MTRSYAFVISYGKNRVPLYRVYAQPLTGITPIPESTFTGRPNTLFALEVDVEVFGNNFLPAYLVGDNSSVVATDSMKNFILRQTLDYTGSTLEGLLEMLGQRFLETYSQMERLQLRLRELPFQPAALPASAGPGSRESAVLFSRSRSDYTTASMDFERAGQEVIVTSHRCGRVGMELFKVTGSAFTHFVRDEYTTLAERVDRPLFIFLDVYWTYADVASLLSPDHAAYVPAEQVRDFVQFVFDEFVSESIQHLVYEIGRRLLERFPQLASVSFDAQNHTRDLVVASEDDERVKVYTDPFNAYGGIKLTLMAEDVAH